MTETFHKAEQIWNKNCHFPRSALEQYAPSSSVCQSQRWSLVHLTCAVPSYLQRGTNGDTDWGGGGGATILNVTLLTLEWLCIKMGAIFRGESHKTVLITHKLHNFWRERRSKATIPNVTPPPPEWLHIKTDSSENHFHTEGRVTRQCPQPTSCTTFEQKGDPKQLYLILHCHHQNDHALRWGSNDSHFKRLKSRDSVNNPQVAQLLKRRSKAGNRTIVCLRLTPYH